MPAFPFVLDCRKFLSFNTLEIQKGKEYYKLNKDGQRISIRIELDRKDKSEKVSFISGWMVYPNGLIHLNTPYGAE